MKFTFVLDSNREEETIIYAHEKTELIKEIEQLITNSSESLFGYAGNDTVRIESNDVYCFIVEDNKVYAICEKEKLQLKCRLYNLEGTLSDKFIKINKSCVANLQKIERFSVDFSGSLKVTFKNGYTEYVSRRNIKNVKERLGCK